MISHWSCLISKCLVSPSLYLTRLNLPLSDAWQAEQIASFTSSERARLARISRPQRRAQFVAAHCMLRSALVSGGVSNAIVEVDDEGRLQLHAGVTVYASISHSQDFVAAIAAGEPVGVDLECIRPKLDPDAAASMLELSSVDADTPDAVLRAWVTAEARLKAGPGASPQVWLSRWESCQLAVAGIPIPPLTGVFDGMTGIYNVSELKWDAV